MTTPTPPHQRESNSGDDEQTGQRASNPDASLRPDGKTALSTALAVFAGRLGAVVCAA